MASRLKILFLPRWYPNRNDPMPGLFILKQAEGLARLCDVAVVYVHPEVHCPNKYEVEFSEENQVRVLRVYYRVPGDRSGWTGSAIKFYRFYRANFRALKSIRAFDPDIIHAHILTRTAVVAFRVSRLWKKPFLISEHWSRYFRENPSFNGFIRKQVTRFIVRKANAVIPVSELLRKSMIDRKLFSQRYVCIPNVVETDLFTPGGSRQPGKVRMIHVSCFEDRSKNISGFLRSVKSLLRKRNDFECLLVGEGPDLGKMKEYARELGLGDQTVNFTGLKQGDALVEAYRSADFLVLSSRYETFGTVVVEAMSCGLPVVATCVGIIPEFLNQDHGISVEAGDDEALAAAMDRMVETYGVYDREKIRASVIHRFSSNQVTEKLIQLYQEFVS
jgi:glycosyltransferase involved in cell wall biosynthesis